MNLPKELVSIHEKRLKDLNNPKYLNGFTALSSVKIENNESVWNAAKELMPWKKGPFNFCNQTLDGEWNCDLKWQRLKPALSDLTGKRVLDLGCNNGWYMSRLREQGASEVIGFDPMPLNWMQWKLNQKLYPDTSQEFYLLGVEDLPSLPSAFDAILSFGVLYHHRNPIQQLIDLRESLVPGGTLYLETIGIPGEEEIMLIPKDRYANMPNVWMLPTLSALIVMLERSRFTSIEVISTKWEGVDEQRATEWTTGPSYKDILDPNDSSKTMEGHPAPERFMVKAQRKPIA